MPGDKHKRHPDADRIRSFAWDCTIGAGRVGDEFPDEPDADAVNALSRILKRLLTPDDEAELVNAWRQCEIEQEFP